MMSIPLLIDFDIVHVSA